MMKLFSKTLQPSSEILEAKRGEAGHRWMELDREDRQLQAQLAQDRIQRAELLEERDTEGTDNAEELRRVEGRIAAAQRRLGELEDRKTVARRRMDALNVEVRNARQREAPDRMLQLSAQHRELLAELRGGLQQAITALRQIPPLETEGVQLQREFDAPPAKTTPLSFFAQDALSSLETLAAKIPPPFEEAEKKTAAEALREAEERNRKQLQDFLNYGGGPRRYEEPAPDGGVVVLNPRLVLSREQGTPFLGAEYVTEQEAAIIRKEMEATGR